MRFTTYPTVTQRRLIATCFGALRCGIGLVMLVDPVRLPRLLHTDLANPRDVTWLGRMVGARELALGVGTLDAVRRSGELRGWFAAQAVSDGGDAVALVAALRDRQVSPGPALLIMSAAAGGAAVDVLAAGGMA